MLLIFFFHVSLRYCLQHARKAALLRQRSTRKKRPKETPETLLEELDHYATSECETDIRKYRHNNESLASRIIGKQVCLPVSLCVHTRPSLCVRTHLSPLPSLSVSCQLHFKPQKDFLINWYWNRIMINWQEDKLFSLN